MITVAIYYMEYEHRYTKVTCSIALCSMHPAMLYGLSKGVDIKAAS